MSIGKPEIRGARSPALETEVYYQGSLGPEVLIAKPVAARNLRIFAFLIVIQEGWRSEDLISMYAMVGLLSLRQQSHQPRGAGGVNRLKYLTSSFPQPPLILDPNLCMLPRSWRILLVTYLLLEASSEATIRLRTRTVLLWSSTQHHEDVEYLIQILVQQQLHRTQMAHRT
jgi:hypothetical protein